MSQLDLFDVGERAKDLPAVGSSRRYTCTADIPGTGPAGETCKTCLHYCRVQHKDYFYLKCGLMKSVWTHGPERTSKLDGQRVVNGNQRRRKVTRDRLRDSLVRLLGMAPKPPKRTEPSGEVHVCTGAQALGMLASGQFVIVRREVVEKIVQELS